ncbi:MAG TPA: M6 family metalloprotease domain-containing protein [bacterium]|nr:M6 family metalloprotease domain-containing protein [bacterium]
MEIDFFKMKKRANTARGFFLVLIFIFSFFSLIFTAPYNGDIFELLQPDGSYVEVKVWGDEYHQHIESMDGYTLIKDEATKWICYAKLSDDGEDYLSTGITYGGADAAAAFRAAGRAAAPPGRLRIKPESVRRKAARVKELIGAPPVLPAGVSPAPSEEGGDDDVPPQPAPPSVTRIGSYVGLTLLIDFPDAPATIPRQNIDDFCNMIGYSGYTNYGSIRDYFLASSDNKLDYTNIVTAYYTAQNPKSYYTDESISFGTRARALIREALQHLEAQGFNFSQLSTDSGRIIAINAMYAGGVDNAWSKGLWPHAGSMNNVFCSGSICSGRYQITNIGTSPAIRTFIHENGHMLLRWPDLYDYGSESRGAGNFCIMAAGGNNRRPVPPNPYFRQLCGWEALTQINSSTNEVFVRESNLIASLRYGNPASVHEAFYLEPRNRTGWNYYLPGSGLLIWHVEGNGSNDNEQMTCSQHYMVSAEQADGLFHLENNNNSGQAADLWTSAHTQGFSDTTTPDSNWWCHGPSGLRVSEISAAGTVMSFRIGSGGTTPTATRTRTPTRTPTRTITPTRTRTATQTPGGDTPTEVTPSVTSTMTRTPVPTASFTGTRTPSPTVTITPLPPGYTELQAEQSCYFDGVIAAIRPGYTGTGYVNIDNMTGSLITFYLDAQSAQSISLGARFANGSLNNRDMSVFVNGEEASQELVFPSTGSWSVWHLAYVTIGLSQGRNEITIVSITEEGGPHLDLFTYASVSVSTAQCVLPTATRTVTPIVTATVTGTPTFTGTRTATFTRTVTNTLTRTSTPTFTGTATQTVTATATATHTETDTRTSTPTYTGTITHTSTPTSTPTYTVTGTATFTGTYTSTRTPTPTVYLSATPTFTPTPAPESGIFRITKAEHYSQPFNPLKNNRLYVDFAVSQGCKNVKFGLYTAGYRRILEREIAANIGAGNHRAFIEAAEMMRLSNGTYYWVIEAVNDRGERTRGSVNTMIVLR